MWAKVFKLGWNASPPHALVSVFPLSSLKSLATLRSFPGPVFSTRVICPSLNSGKFVLTFPEESTVSCQPSSLPVCKVAEGRGCGTKRRVPASPRPVLTDINDSLKNQGHFLPETRQDWFLGQRPHLKLAGVFIASFHKNAYGLDTILVFKIVILKRPCTWCTLRLRRTGSIGDAVHVSRLAD